MYLNMSVMLGPMDLAFEESLVFYGAWRMEIYTTSSRD